MSTFSVILFLIICLAVLPAPPCVAQLGLARIINGIPSFINKTKYIVQVRFSDEFCAGSLIRPRWVLTAAHCILNRNASEFIVYANATMIEGEYIISRRVDFVAKHPRFRLKTIDYDAGMLRLAREFDEVNVDTIELAERRVPPRHRVRVSGWGQRHADAKRISDRLYTVTVPVWSRRACKRIYRGFHRITKSMFCAGKPQFKRDACYGDSGGPLVYKGELAGIVSWGRDCESRFPGVYTSVPAIRLWAFDVITNYTVT